MSSILVFSAFVCGFIVSRIGLPPLVGYLLAGFGLHYFGVQSSEPIQYLADMGILLLLFSIGLKLKVKSLLRPEIWGSASAHMGLTVCIFGALLYLMGMTGLAVFSDFSAPEAVLLAFGLSFSSTVFAVKTFEQRGDLDSLYGRITIGILIIQDIAAVIFLTFSKGVFPSPYAPLLLVGLFILRPALLALLARVGHQELLLLFGLFVPISLGAGAFEYFQLKPDLGALILGMMLAGSPKANELSDSILNLKDLFLVGFFLDIGLSGTPTVSTLVVAIGLVMLVALKSALFFAVLTRFKLRARTALFTGLALSNYSEFGLLVCSIAVKQGLLPKDWLVTMASALALSFLAAAPFNSRAHSLYVRFSHPLQRFQTRKRLSHDLPIDIGEANVLIFGMGRIGTKVYDVLKDRDGLRLIGLDFVEDAVKRHRGSNRNVILADATDLDLWEKICTHSVQWAMLTMASHQANMYAIEMLQASGFTGRISVTARFSDDLKELEDAGVCFAYDLYQEAGQGYADKVLDQCLPPIETEQ